MGKAKKEYYAVVKGRVPGIYKSWYPSAGAYFSCVQGTEKEKPKLKPSVFPGLYSRDSIPRQKPYYGIKRTVEFYQTKKSEMK